MLQDGTQPFLVPFMGADLIALWAFRHCALARDMQLRSMPVQPELRDDLASVAMHAGFFAVKKFRHMQDVRDLRGRTL